MQKISFCLLSEFGFLPTPIPGKVETGESTNTNTAQHRDRYLEKLKQIQIQIQIHQYLEKLNSNTNMPQCNVNVPLKQVKEALWSGPPIVI